MNKISRVLLLSAVSIVLMAGSAMAAAPITSTNTTSEDIVSNLGFFSDLAAFVLQYAKYGAFLIAILCLLGLLAATSISKFHKKVEQHVDTRKSLTDFLIDGILFVVCMIVLFSFIIPQVNQFIPL